MKMVSLRAANSGDLPAIAAMQAASRVASQWNPEEYLSYDCTVAVVEERVVGFLVVRQAGPDREVLNFAVDQGYRRRGIARRLMEAEFARGECKRYLEVRESNLAAIEFYRNVGFHQSGRRAGYYDDPPEAALVFMKSDTVTPTGG